MTVVCALGLLVSATAALPMAGADSAGEHQVLINPDFSLALVDDTPPGWFRAMMPHLTTGLQAGVGQDETGPYLFLEQQGVEGQLFNNWAQRIEKPAIGAQMRLETEVAVRNAQGKGAVVLIMFFDKGGRILGGASSEGQVDLTGMKDFTPVRLEAVVPPNCDLAIVRLGLSPAPGQMKVRYARLYLLDGERGPEAVAASASNTQEGQAGLELLVNGNFEGGMVLDTPVGWFRAMMPGLAINHSAGMESVPGRGNVAFIRQEGVHAQVVNNWAQQVDVVPMGARLQLTADVKTEGLPENTGFVMMQCWDEADRLVGAATSQSAQPLGGTRDWTTVSMEIVVPVRTSTIIVRCGLAQSGTIWFDNVSLTIIAPGLSQPADTTRVPARGFEVTAESLQQLESVQDLSEELLAYCAERLGEKVKIRRQIHVQPDGTFQVSLLLDFSGR